MATANIKAVITAEDHASSVVSGFGSNVGKMAGAVAIGQLAVQGITAAMQKFQEAGKFAVEAASDFEQNRIAFETMLGSADRARGLLQQISDFAASTPFDLPQVAEGARHLLAFGISAEQIIPTFKMLGNIAAGVGKEKLPEIVNAFGQVRVAGRLMGQELLQFINAGVPLIDLLAEHFNKPTDEIKKMVEQGKVGFADVQAALSLLGGETGRWGDLMKKQSQTFSGTLSNIKDQFVRLALDFMGVTTGGDIEANGFFAKIKRAAEGLLNWLNANRGNIQTFFTNVQIFGERAFQVISQAINFLMPFLRELWGSVQNQLMPAFRRFWHEVVVPLAPAIGAILVGAIIAIIGAIRLWIGITTVLMNIFSAAASFIRQGIEGIKIAINIMRATWEAASNAVMGAIRSVINWVNNLIERFTGISGAVQRGVSGVSGAIEAAFKPVLTVIGWINNLIGAISRIDPGKVSAAGAAAAAVASISGGKAFGGFVTGGQAVVVGERGPELFVPQQSGSIVPNETLHQVPSSGGTTIINISPQIGVYAGSQMEKRTVALELFEALKDIANQNNMTVAQVLGG